MRLEVLGGIAGVQAIMLLASVALAAYPNHEVGRSHTTTCVTNVCETLEANVVASQVDGPAV